MQERKGCFSIVLEIGIVVGVFVWLWKKSPGAVFYILAIIAAVAGMSVWITKAQNRWKAKKQAEKAQYSGMSNVDQMSGIQFERWCGALIANLGFRNVRYTKATGDHGVDIVAERDGVRYAIQCKCYSGPVGNSPVQEVQTGKVMYRCDRCIVMTNSYFTSGAISLAQANGVELWDRSKLEILQRKAAKMPAKTGRDEWDNLFDVITVVEDDDW